jgi:hypothetical protein
LPIILLEVDIPGTVRLEHFVHLHSHRGVSCHFLYNASPVGGFNPIEKYESQLGLVFPIYGKTKAMFQATSTFQVQMHSQFISQHLGTAPPEHQQDHVFRVLPGVS